MGVVAYYRNRSIIKVDSVREHIDNYIRQDIPPSVEKQKGSKDRASKQGVQIRGQEAQTLNECQVRNPVTCTSTLEAIRKNIMKNELDYVDLLQKELDKRGLDAEIDMILCGNLNMVCRITLDSLLAGNCPNTGFPKCVKVFTKK